MDTGTVRLTAAFKGSGCSIAGATANDNPIISNPSVSAIELLAFGTGSGQGNLVACFALTIALSSNATINLYDGSILDIFEKAAAFRKLRAFYAAIEADGDTSGVTISPGASNPNSLWWGGTTPTKTIYPGGPPELGGQPAGLTVDATHNAIKFTNNSGATAVTVRVALAGSDS